MTTGDCSTVIIWLKKSIPGDQSAFVEFALISALHVTARSDKLQAKSRIPLIIDARLAPRSLIVAQHNKGQAHP
jgi:hypothetical protein